MRLEDEMDSIGQLADGKLLAGRIGNVGIMLFNQPGKRNAMNLEMWEAVGTCIDMFERDETVRVLVYAGVGGKSFTSGNDISEFAERRSNADANAEFSRITSRGREKLSEFTKPSIACIEGFCMGGGLGTALRADIRVAGSDAVFSVPAARLGIAYAFDATERLVAQIGASRARLMLYTARKFSGKEAFAMGLVEVLSESDAASQSLSLANEIAGNAPLSVRASKFSIGEMKKPPGQRDAERMAEIVRACMDSADYREGRTAFMQKRKPTFKGS